MPGDSSNADLSILVIDIGGSNVKIWRSGSDEKVKFRSGPKFTPRKLLKRLKKRIAVTDFDRVSIGYPGEVWDNRPATEPLNLGKGWLNYDFNAEFARPTKIMNDASMQALGSYEGGRMLYLGLGTGVGTVMVVEGLIMPVAPAALRLSDGRRLGQALTADGLRTLGLDHWQSNVHEVALTLRMALGVDYVVIGGGNAKLLTAIPEGCRRGGNHLALVGGERMWSTSSYTDLGRVADEPLHSVQQACANSP
jgi:predicted NBD/HSP70 family sugar kinase